MSDCDHMCTKCDGKPCIEFRPKMAVPRELQADYEMMVTANLLMAASIESIKRKDEQLKAENAKLRELVAEMFNACPMCVNCAHNHLTVGWYDRMRELGIEVDA